MPVMVYESYTRVCLFNLLRLSIPRGLEMEIVLSRTDNPALQLEKLCPYHKVIACIWAKLIRKPTSLFTLLLLLLLSHFSHVQLCATP